MPSLSTLLDDKAFRESINNNFSFPRMKLDAVLLVKPNSNAGVNFGAVGTAYDYCLRLALMRTHNLDNDKIKSFSGYIRYQTSYQPDDKVRGLMEPHLRTLNKYLGLALSDETALFQASLFLAKFDSEYRSGLPILNWNVKPQDIDELHRLVSHSRLDWTNKESIELGPVFDRQGSRMPINADGDLIVGKALIDVKTSSRMELKANFRQLLGYYALNQFSSVPFDIDALGVYYPRFDFFLEIPINELISESQEKELISLFRQALGDNIECEPVRSAPEWVPVAVADAFIRLGNGETLLHHATYNKDSAEIMRLLTMGADINAKNDDGRTALHLAVGSKAQKISKLLIDAGANVNAADTGQATPLMYATVFKQKNIANMLLNAGANVNCQDDDGCTPLRQAVLDGNKELAAMLRKRGAIDDEGL